MCGRFILLTDLSIITATFCIGEADAEYRPGRCIAPGQPVSAVVRERDVNILTAFRWGLIPSWAKDPAIGSKMFNARAETIAEKPSFREAFRRRRCLIVADGFYEWQKTGRAKKPLLFSLKSGEPFSLAGLYETWIAPDRQKIGTCTIITTEPNALIRPVHDRMPVILAKEKAQDWIDPGADDAGRLRSLLVAYPAEKMLMTAIPAGDQQVP